MQVATISSAKALVGLAGAGYETLDGMDGIDAGGNSGFLSALAGTLEKTSRTHSLYQPSFRHLLLLRSYPLDLKDRDAVMLAFPALPVQTKALRFWLRDTREHAHLQDHFARICSGFGLDRAKVYKFTSQHHSPRPHESTSKDHILPVFLTEVPKHAIAASSGFVFVVLERPIAVFDLNLIGCDEHVRSDIAARHFATVGTGAEMPARVLEEVFGFDGDSDAAAETAACHAVGEGGGVVLFGVAGELGHVW